MVTANTSQRSRVGVGMNRSVREGMPIYDYCTLRALEFIMTNFITIVYKHRQSNYCTQLIIIWSGMSLL